MSRKIVDGLLVVIVVRGHDIGHAHVHVLNCDRGLSFHLRHFCRYGLVKTSTPHKLLGDVFHFLRGYHLDVVQVLVDVIDFILDLNLHTLHLKLHGVPQALHLIPEQDIHLLHAVVASGEQVIDTLHLVNSARFEVGKGRLVLLHHILEVLPFAVILGLHRGGQLLEVTDPLVHMFLLLSNSMLLINHPT